MGALTGNPTTDPRTDPTMNPMFLLLLLAVVMILPSFLLQRRQRAEAAKTTAMQNTLQVGDRVVTTSGLYGTIVEVDDTTIDLEIAEDVITTWLKMAIREVRADEAEGETDAVEATSIEDAPPANGVAPAELPTAEHDKD